MVVIESTLLQQVVREIPNDPEGVLRVLSRLEHPITVDLKRWEEWEVSVNGGCVDLRSSVATHLEYFDRQYPYRQHERAKASIQALIDLMASYDQTGVLQQEPHLGNRQDGFTFHGRTPRHGCASNCGSVSLRVQKTS